MKQNKFGEMIFNEDDVCDLLMQGKELNTLDNMLIDGTISLEKLALLTDCMPHLINYDGLVNNDHTIEEFDRSRQRSWHMPVEYQTMDIAQYVLEQCKTDAELQRCGHELIMFQERNLFDLLKFLKYLVDTMTEHRVIWGVGRGSSVASYVLYKLGVHKINSMFYELSPEEFLR